MSLTIQLKEKVKRDLRRRKRRGVQAVRAVPEAREASHPLTADCPGSSFQAIARKDFEGIRALL